MEVLNSRRVFVVVAILEKSRYDRRLADFRRSKYNQPEAVFRRRSLVVDFISGEIGRRRISIVVQLVIVPMHLRLDVVVGGCHRDVADIIADVTRCRTTRLSTKLVGDRDGSGKLMYYWSNAGLFRSLVLRAATKR